MIKLIMFDLDGTLHNTIEKIKHCYEVGTKSVGIEPNWEVARTFLGMPYYVFAKKVVGDKAEGYIEAYRNEYLSMDECPLYDGSKEILIKLKEKYKIALVTGKPRDITIDTLKYLQVSDLFDYLVCADDTKYQKPHPEPLNKVLEHYGFKAEESIYIGDGLFDVEASKGAHVPIIAVTWGGTTKERLIKETPSYIADNWEDVEKIINYLE